jgi:hypothetical protein
MRQTNSTPAGNRARDDLFARVEGWLEPGFAAFAEDDSDNEPDQDDVGEKLWLALFGQT